MKNKQKKLVTSVTLGDMISWWNHDGHFNEELYIKLTTIKSKQG